MKAKKTKKGHTSHDDPRLPPSSGTDTSRWESLLAGSKPQKSRAARLTLGHRISAVAPTNTISNGTVANGNGPSKQSHTLPAGKHMQGKGPNGGGAAPSGASNWEKLLTVPSATSPKTVPDASSLSSRTDGNSKTSKRSKAKRKRAIAGTGASGLSISGKGAASGQGTGIDFFKAVRSSTENSKQANGKKRQQSRTNNTNQTAADSPQAQTVAPSVGNRSTNPGGEHDRHHKKRPPSNVLNLAFQAQKAAAELQQKGDKERGRANGVGVSAGGVGGSKRRAGRGAELALTSAEQAQYVGLDCEMVGVGPGGCRSALARCCMVNWEGTVMYDKHVMPNERVTDFRTFVSGVKAKHLRDGITLRKCQEEVAAILKGKTLVGHALHHDLKALMLSHPPRMTRDTSTYRPYQKAHGKAGGRLRPMSLKMLSLEYLERTIQEGQHHPAEDARAAMDLYKVARYEWEKSLSAASKKRGRRAVVDQQDH